MTWNVLFVDYSDIVQAKWARIWTRKGFRHVLAMGYDAYNEHWLFVEPRPGQCLIRLANEDEVNNFIVFCKEKGKSFACIEQHVLTHVYVLR